jgi:hypothetical protein
MVILRKNMISFLIVNIKKEKFSYIPTFSGSPSMIASNMATKTRANGLNIVGYEGPLIVITHDIKQNVAAVANAPYTKLNPSS